MPGDAGRGWGFELTGTLHERFYEFLEAMDQLIADASPLNL